MVKKMQIKFPFKSLCLLSILFVYGCNQPSSNASAQNTNKDHNPSPQAVQEEKVEMPEIWPEDDTTKTGTAVLGFKLGDSTYESVTRTLAGWDDLGTNSYSQGKMIATNGNGYGIDDLKKVTYIFNSDDALQAVLMQIDNRDKMGNEGFKKFKSYIEKRGYKRVSNQEPFVGDQYAEYVTPTGDHIEINAPHMSFDLNIDYQTAAFMKTFNTRQQQQKIEKRNTEAAQF